jgi:hypothetical protein
MTTGGKTDDTRLPPWAVLAGRQCATLSSTAFGSDIGTAYARVMSRHHAIHEDQLAAALDEAIKLLLGAGLWDEPEKAEPMIRLRAVLAMHRSQ